MTYASEYYKWPLPAAGYDFEYVDEISSFARCFIEKGNLKLPTVFEQMMFSASSINIH